MGLFGTVDSYDNKGPVGGATNPLTGAALSRDRENQRAILELDGTQAYESVTILDGSISPKRAEIVVDTEGGASADTLETILTNTDGSTTLHDGMKLTLRSADPSRSVTVKHSNSEFGIQMVDAQDVVLGTKWGLKLKLIANKWFEDQGRAATTTSRGIARVATLADMEPGAVVENGPAFLAAGVHTSVAPAAGKIPVTDPDGSVNNLCGARYATCATAAATAAKVADLVNFQLVKGARVFVTFSNANTVAGALTLNVNGTGAKAIYNELGAVSASNPAAFPAGVPIEFIYDGINWTYRKYQDEFAKVVGGAPMYACRAWINFDSTTTPITVKASGNISSITDNGVGDYTINFTNPMPHANYAVGGSARFSTATGAVVFNILSQTVSQLGINHIQNNALADTSTLCVQIFC